MYCKVKISEQRYGAYLTNSLKRRSMYLCATLYIRFGGPICVTTNNSSGSRSWSGYFD